MTLLLVHCLSPHQYCTMHWADMVSLPPSGDIKQESGLYRDGPSYQRRGSLQLWQFLVALLDDPSNSHFIAWTGRGMEFKLIEPEEVRNTHTSANKHTHTHRLIECVEGVDGWTQVCNPSTR